MVAGTFCSARGRTHRGRVSADEPTMTAPPRHPSVHTERDAREPAGDRARRSGRSVTAVERRAVLGIAIVSGLVAATSGAEPTALASSDLILLFGFGAAVPLLAARARRWTWIVLAGVAGIAGPPGLWAAVALASLVLAVVGSVVRRRIVIGATVAALSLQVLLRLPELGFHGGSALVAAIAVAPAVVSGYLLLPTRRRRTVGRVALGVGIYLGVALLLAGGAGLLAQQSVRAGLDEARTGLAAVGDGETAEAAASFDAAEASLDTATAWLGGVWMVPARTLPIVGQHIDLLDSSATQAREISASAADVARAADVQQFRYEDGWIDLTRVELAQAPLAAAHDALVEADETLDDLDDGWLLPPARRALDDLRSEVVDARGDAEVATMAAGRLPSLLGAAEPQRYLVLFTQPAESRGLGGFVGAYAELTAVNGSVEVTRSGPITELLRAPGAEARTLTGPPGYLERYGRYQPARYLQDLTLSPDMSAVATAAAELYPQAGGAPVDGVIVVDPAGLAALMALTGPVAVDGLDTPLSSANAEAFLTRDQYLQFPDDETRQDFLEEAGRATFEQLVEGSLPSPREMGDVLGPAVAGRRLMMYSFDPADQALLGRLGAGGFAVPAAAHDSFFFTTQNKGNNKIDTFLQRSIRYEVTVDPATGELRGTAEITLRNDAPAEGLPPSVIGNNDQGLPFGTNVANLSFYTRQRMVEASVDGAPQAMEFQRELGYAVYSRYLVMAPGQETVVRFTLVGRVPAGSTYTLEVPADPAVVSAKLDVDVRLAEGWQLSSIDGFIAVSDSHARAQVRLTGPFLGVVESRREGTQW